MLLPGYWLLCEDGVLRPIFQARLVTGAGLPLTVEFLADTGVDRTVLCAAVLPQPWIANLSSSDNVGRGGRLNGCSNRAYIHRVAA